MGKCAIDKAMEKAYNALLNRDDDDDEVDKLSEDAEDEIDVEQELLNNRKERKVESFAQKKGKKKDELFDSDDDIPVIDSDEDSAPTRTTRGRGRARGSRGGIVTARGRAAAKSPAKRGGRGRAPAQSTITAAFARSQQSVRQSQPSQASARPSQRNKKQMFESDSDDDLLGAL